MIVKITLFGLVSLLAALFYKIPYFKKKQIVNIGLVQFYYLFVGNVIGTFIAALFVIEIFSRQHIHILPYSDQIFLAIFLMIFSVTNLGIGIHGFTKIFDKLIQKTQIKKNQYKIVDIFHRSLSHIIIYSFLILFAFFLGMFEVNHPSINVNVNTIVLFGLIMGFSLGYSMNQYYKKKIVYVFLFMSLLLSFELIFFMQYQLIIQTQPYYTLTRTFFIGIWIFLIFSLIKK